MILFAGQVGREMREREAFQELDFRAVFGSMAKWVVEIDDPARIPELVTRAFRVAMQGRPGPVVVALPEDMLTEAATVADAPRVDPAPIWPAPDAMAQFRALLAEAKRPIAILGGSRWTEEAARAVHPLRRTAGSGRGVLVPAGSISSPPTIPISSAMSASDRIRCWPSGSNPPIWCCCWAGGCRKCRPRPIRCSMCRCRIRRSSTFIRVRRSWAASISRRWRSRRHPPISAPPSVWAASRIGVRAATRKCCGRPMWPGRRRRSPYPDRFNMARWSAGCATGCPPTRSSAMARATMPAGSIAITACATSAPSSPRHRARWAMACRPRSWPSASTPTGSSCRSRAMAAS